MLHRSLAVLTLVCAAGCAAERPPDAAYPTGESAPTTAEPKESAEEDEVAEEKAIVNDPAVIATAQKVNDVLGRIEVQGKMGKEDEADKELLTRASAMHADVVIDIGFEHGEGGSEPTKV
jgi:hypothetical protein